MVLAFLALFLPAFWSQPVSATDDIERAGVPPDTAAKEVSGETGTREGHPRDISRFLEMDDPLEAAVKLREHAERHGLSPEEDDPRGWLSRLWPWDWKDPTHHLAPELIHVSSGHEFKVTTGIEEDLMLLVEGLRADSLDETQIVCIVLFQPWWSIDGVIATLEAGARIFDRVGRGAYIVRMPASSVTILGSADYVRWIGEYRPEYKYNPRELPGKKIEAHIYPLGGDRDAYRADLAELDIVLRSVSIIGFYLVELEAERFQEVAEKLWWVREIHRCPEEAYH
jgi:hypothetical protein